MPAANVVGYLSIPGSHLQLYVSRSDSLGIIRFYTNDFYGPGEIVLQTDNRTDTTSKIEVIDPFSNKFSSSNFAPFNPGTNITNLLSDYSVSVQVQNNFVGEKLKQFYLPLIDSIAFFGSPDVQYLLDNYTRFSTMEEVLREYVYEVLVRRQKENFRLIVADVDNKIFLDDPLILLNGIPEFDANAIIKYDPLKVRKIEIIKRKYFYGPALFNGIISFTTYELDPAVLNDLNPLTLGYEGMQYQREFYSPVYETKEQISSRLPDFRNVLYWSPNIQMNDQGKTEINFFTSDMKGRYVVLLQGISMDGRSGKSAALFEVK